MFRYGEGRARLLKKHSDTFSVAGFTPLFFTLFILLGLLATIALPVLLLPYAAVIGLYFFVVLAFSTHIAITSKSIDRIWQLPLVFATIHFGAGLGLLKELVSKHTFITQS